MNVQTVTYSDTSQKADALSKLDNPYLIFGDLTWTSPYVIIFADNVGDSPLGGGQTMITGFIYANNQYGAQIAIEHTGTVVKRNKYAGVWSDWE